MINKLISLALLIFFLTTNYSYSENQFLFPKKKPSVFEKIKKNYRKNKVKFYNKFSDFNLKNLKFDITISAIVGIAGLEPTIQFTNISKKVLL